MTVKYFAKPQKDFTIVKGRHDEIPFIIYKDSSLTERKDITYDALLFVVRVKWDRLEIVFELSTDMGIEKTNPLQGECKLLISPTESDQDPGAYVAELLLIEPSEEKYAIWVSAFDIKYEVAG